jgi:hypothetical protein
VKPFRVRLTSKSALRIEKPISFHGPESTLLVQPDLVQDRQTKDMLHRRLMFTADVNAQSIGEAVREAVVLASGIAGDMCLAHATAIEDPQWRFVLSKDPDATSVLILQAIRDTP